MNRDKLKATLRLEENEILHPYTDSVGKITIGVGHNLTDKGIPQEVSDILLDYDIDECIAQLHQHFPWYLNLPDVRQRVITDMCFNMGIGTFLTLHTLIDGMERKDYDYAATRMLSFRWAKQVKGRAVRLAKMMRTGEDE